MTINVNDVDEFDVTVPTDSDGATDEVTENTLIGTAVGITADVFDLDATNNTITYSLTSNPDGLFTIDANTGVVTTAAAIDRELHGATRSITVEAASSDGSTATQSFNVIINDVDEFDVSVPTDVDGATVEVTENTLIGTTVGITADAFDLDATNNTITYSLTSNPDGLFTIDANTGVVTTAAAIDRELHSATRSITVQAASSDGSTATQNFNITINDVDEFDVSVPTDVDGATDEVTENTLIGTTVGITADAFDLDATNSTITYSLTSNPDGLFTIDANTGVVTTAAAIDLELHGATRSITVEAASSDGSTATQNFNITINDVDEFDVSVPTDVDGATDEVTENTLIGTTVGITADAFDLDATNNTITYSLTSNPDGLFTIDANTGVVTTAAAIDLELHGATRSITVEAASSDGSTATQNFNITINDVDEFDVSVPTDVDGATDEVTENTLIGTAVGITADAFDLDATNNTITYSLTSNPDGLFTIDANTGVVTTAAAIDREVHGAIRSITVEAASSDGSTATQSFNITINDVDEFDVSVPTDVDGATDEVTENTIIGTTVGITADAFDLDATDNTITYSLTSNPDGLFAIDANSGVVTVAAAIDREADGPSRNITVRATSTDGSFSDQVFGINIHDVDEFDVGAVSDGDVGTNGVDENAAIGTNVGITASAMDADATNNSITYSLSDDDGGRFAIDSNSGVVTVAGAIDREADGPSRNITARATSADGSFTDQVFAININDVDEFDVGAVTDTDGATNEVSENAAIGTVVGIAASAGDADATTNSITYSLTDDDGGRFMIDSGSGVVTVAGAIDREADGASRNLTIRATSADGSFFDQTFTINVNDVDEFDASVTTDVDGTLNAVSENAAVGTAVGITASASDADATINTINYSLIDDDGGRFAINPSTGVVTVAAAIDREADGPSRSVTVRATSADGSFTDQVFVVNINDLDEFDTTATLDLDATVNEVDENAAIGTTVGIIASASDADATNNTITYSLDDSDGGRFAVDSSSGLITVAAAIDREADGTSRNITVRSTSSDGSFTTAVFAIGVGDVDEFDVSTPIDSDVAANFVNENSAFGTTVGLTALASDADATDSVTYSLSDSAGGRFAINSSSGLVTVSGSLDFETSANHNITVRATSTDGSIATQVVTINVGDVNEAPVAADDHGYSSPAGTALTLNAPSPLLNDVDVDGDALVIQVVSPPSNGTLSIDAFGNLVYTPNSGFFGTDTITYRADDGVLTSNLVVISIDVIAGTTSGGTDPTPDPDPDPVPDPTSDGGDPGSETDDDEEEPDESETEPSSQSVSADADPASEQPQWLQVKPVRHRIQRPRERRRNAGRSGDSGARVLFDVTVA